MENKVVWALALACFVLSAEAADVDVHIPATYYWADKTPLVAKTDFKYTQVAYGKCSDDEQLLVSIMGGTNIMAGQTVGRVSYVPAGVRLCFVATVMGTDGLPLGRSNVAEFAISPSTKPGQVYDLRIR